MQRHDEHSAAQAEQENGLALEKRLAEKRAQRDDLTLRAPHDGRVIGRDLKHLTGSFIPTGEPVLSVANEDGKELQVAIAQDGIDAFRARIGRRIACRIPGHDLPPSGLFAVTPRVDPRPRHEALCAAFGGPLPVKVRDASDDEDDTTCEFVEARFTGRMRFDSGQGARIAAGRRGWVDLEYGDRRFGAGLYLVASKWIEKTAKQAGLK